MGTAIELQKGENTCRQRGTEDEEERRGREEG
jgi:hypothetical protein